MEKCAKCGKEGEGEELRLCLGCQSLRYCSRDCQKRHWKRHKSKCKRTSADISSRPGEKTKEGEPAVEDGSGEATAPSSDQSSGGGPLKICQRCGLQRAEMNSCGRCLEVTYCSRDCQRADWKSHRVTCQVKVVIKTEGFRRSEEQKLPTSGDKNKALDEGTAQLSATLGDMTLTPETSWEEARSRARQLFPGKQIVDKFIELKNDKLFVPHVPNVVGLVRITCVYPNPYREGRCLQDSAGMTSHVLFHNEDGPSPYFRYNQLREGNFMCYERAYMHVFSDGTLGFRINHAKDVRVIEMSAQRRRTFACSSTATDLSQSWSEARSRAQAAFPGNRVMDSIGDLGAKEGLQSLCSGPGFPMVDSFRLMAPKQMLRFRQGETEVVLVVQLCSPLFHPVQHGWMVKDRKGTNAYLTFRFRGSPAPHFRYDDLHKGHFLCVKKAYVVVEECDFATIDVKEASAVRVLGN